MNKQEQINTLHKACINLTGNPDIVTALSLIAAVIEDLMQEKMLIRKKGKLR